MNTPHQGTVRYIVFRDKGKKTWYAAGLEFNIVESGEDPRIALLNLFDALDGYMQSMQKVKGARLSPLNQKTDPDYEVLWSVVTAPKKVKSPFEISTYGVTTV
jgi:hypothetical protein